MKKDDLEKELLLYESGELSTKRKRRLQRYLAESPDARTLQVEIQTLMDTTRSHTDSPEVPPFILEQIKEEGRRALKKRDAVEQKTFRSNLLPRLAYGVAGLMILAFASWLLFQGPPASLQQAVTAHDESFAWNDGFDEDLEEIEILLAMSSLDDADDFELKSDTADDLARELLILDGEKI